MFIDRNSIDGINEHETDFLYDEIFVRAGYQPAGVELPENAVVFDVGANIGMYSLFAAATCPTATIYAFEPLPPIVAMLRRNLTAHGVRAQVLPCGLSDAERQVPFTYYPGYSTMSTQTSYLDTTAERAYVQQLVGGPRPATSDQIEPELMEELLKYQFREQSFTCRVRRLSNIVDERGVGRVDMLKIDVQRAELDVLRGIDDRHWPLIRQIAVEVHDEAGTPTEGRLGELLGTLARRGFRTLTGQTTAVEGRQTVFAVRDPVP